MVLVYFDFGGLNIFGLCGFISAEYDWIAYTGASLWFIVGIFFWVVILYFGAKTKGFRRKNKLY